MTPEQKECADRLMVAVKKVYSLPVDHPLRVEWQELSDKAFTTRDDKLDELRVYALELCERIIAT